MAGWILLIWCSIYKNFRVLNLWALFRTQKYHSFHEFKDQIFADTCDTQLHIYPICPKRLITTTHVVSFQAKQRAHILKNWECLILEVCKWLYVGVSNGPGRAWANGSPSLTQEYMLMPRPKQSPETSKPETGPEHTSAESKYYRSSGRAEPKLDTSSPSQAQFFAGPVFWAWTQLMNLKLMPKLGTFRGRRVGLSGRTSPTPQLYVNCNQKKNIRRCEICTILHDTTVHDK